MNKKIKILGLSAFIATGMAPLGSTKVFADEANPTQIEEQLDVDENSDIDSIEEEARENQIEDNDQDLDENENIDEENQDIDDVEKDQNIDNNESDQFELIGKPNNSDIPKTYDAGIGGYVETMVVTIGGLFVLIKKMI